MAKEKICPRCETKHTKRGPYCSRSCGNVRVHSEEDKAIRSEKLLDYYQTPEGVATKEKTGRIVSAMRKGEDWESTSIDDFAIDIPDVHDYSSDYDNSWGRADKW